VGGGRDKCVFSHTYDCIISLENLLDAWKEFLKGKSTRKDVLEFQQNLMQNLISLHNDLKHKTYIHSGYTAFSISDPKPRNIHKASVRDRVLHHLLYKELYPFFDTKFISDSYSCRKNKGTHKAILRFESFFRKVSKNYTKQCFVLKCDIKKFFASIDHEILKEILEKYIKDEDLLNLLGNIIDSFSPGLPLGNLTSQLLVNIYMNEFDQFVKHSLKEKYYIRYADDFVFLSQDKKHIEKLIIKISKFLEEKLRLRLHPDKVFIKTIYSGVDFLGWVNFAGYRVLRNSTKRKMIRKLQGEVKEETLASYLGMLKWGNSYKIMEEVAKIQGL
jgi:retron-type reverse transcriptase